ncbi:hypothetical protein [Chryseolinea sp. H1M3-3]|uniref:hypothetical protein n=1 Tax=Chryseolinea sp. H1M3-3 TaxID=3034144 RepID=UPI0023EADFAF|nr:hypothetical protein [Chryseolinea sp. H1M3-3]
MRTTFTAIKTLFIGLMLLNFISCEKQSTDIDRVASLYSDTQVISNIEYINIDQRV